MPVPPKILSDCTPDHCMLLSCRMGKPTICIGENKGADQLRSNCEADQRLCFHYTDSTIPLLSKSKIFQPVTISCDCTARFVSDLVGNHIVGFPTRQLFYLSLSTHLADFFSSVFVVLVSLAEDSCASFIRVKTWDFRFCTSASP